MSDVTADLATLRNFVGMAPPGQTVARDALARVEQELSRLTEEMSHRDRRIKEQRDHIVQLNDLREPGSKHARRKNALLERTIGHQEVGLQRMREQIEGLTTKAETAEARVAELETERDEARAKGDHWFERMGALIVEKKRLRERVRVLEARQAPLERVADAARERFEAVVGDEATDGFGYPEWDEMSKALRALDADQTAAPDYAPEHDAVGPKGDERP